MAHHHPQSSDVVARLARVEGHVRAIKQMSEEGKPCADILLQISAVQAALRKTGEAVLRDHLEQCVLSAEPEEMKELLMELKDALAHYGR